MEERRLKTLISHLSLYSDCPLENSAVLSVINKAENTGRAETSGIPITDITQGNNQHLCEKQKSSMFMSKSGSTSNVFKGRQSGIVEENLMGGSLLHPITLLSQGADVQLKAASQCNQTGHLSASFKGITRNPSPKERSNHSFATQSEVSTQKYGCLLRYKSLFSEVEGNSPCILMNDQGVSLRTSAHEYRLDNSAVSQSSLLQNNSATQVEHVCSSSDPKIYEVEGERKSFRLGKVSVNGVGGGDTHSKLCEADDGEAATMRGLSEEKHVVCRDILGLDSQPVNGGIDTLGSTTLSRNNVMTGQRRHVLEDCIFCLIIQGQSPAFKLYEDEMCICILDVHPLSHGHSLLIPKAHFPSLELTPPEVAAAMCATVPFISMAIMQATNCDSFNLLVNSGKAAGQVVLHTHFHIIPRRSGDNLWRSEDGSRRALPVGHETALLVQQIRHNLSSKCL